MRGRYVFLGMVLAKMITPAFAQDSEQVKSEVQFLPAISVVAVTPKDMRDRIIAGGLVGAVEEVIVQPLVEGQPIETLEADVGDYVTEGQVLAKLSLKTLELQHSQLKAGLAAARATVSQFGAQVLEMQAVADEAQNVAKRTAALKEKGSASQANYEQVQSLAVSANARVIVAKQSLEAARAQEVLAQAQLDNIELNLKRTDVVAPVAGEILTRNAQIGAVASAAGLPMFTMMKDGALEIKLEVSETDMVRLKPGMPAIIRTVKSLKPLKGEVRLVEPSVSLTTRLATARISVERSDELRAGMYAEVEIILAERKGLAVPISAVSDDDNGSSVLRVNGNLVEHVPVKTGIYDGGLVEITQGIKEGDLIVAKAAAFVRAGEKINPILDAAQE